MSRKNARPLLPLVALGVLCAAAPAAAGPPAASTGTVALLGGTLHPVSSPEIPSGTLLMRDGKILALGAGVPIPEGARRVDVTGQHVYPSLLSPLTQLGLEEIESVPGGVDVAEAGDLNPEARPEVAMNLDSEHLAVTRSAGVLVAGIAPRGGLLSGTLAVMELDGWTREDATLKAPAALVVTWPDLSIDRSPAARLSVRLQEKRRDESVRRLKEAFSSARAYGIARAAQGQPGVPALEREPKLEAMLAAVEGRIPVIVQAGTIRQIRAALAWGAEEKLGLVLAGARDAWRAAPEIARAGVPVLLGPVLSLPPREDDPYDAVFAAAGILSKAGVRVALMDATPMTVRNLGHQASTAAAFGLPREAALASVTLEPARILGVDSRVGSLEVGKDATLFVCEGDPLRPGTNVSMAFLEGRSLDLSDRHKRLWWRYRGRPQVSPH